MFSQWWWSSGAEANGDSGVEIGNSLRFRGAQVLTRPVRSAGSTSWTLSLWVKKAQPTGWLPLFTTRDGRTGSIGLQFQFNGVADIAYQSLEVNPPALSSQGQYRDPSAWYHVVCRCDRATSLLTIFMNGEQVAQGATTDQMDFAGNMRFMHGQSGFNTNTGQFFLADPYLIEGQALEPTAFGRENANGVWVPREMDFTPATMRFSDFLTPTVPGTWDDGNATNVFDGSTTTFAGTGANGTWTFAPTTDIAVDNQVRVFALNTAGTISWNGQTATPNGGWVTLTASGNINADTPVVGTTVGAGQSSFINAIEVDGEPLINPFLWSARLFTAPSAATPDWDTTDKQFLVPGGAATGAFDGNNSTEAGTSITPNTGTWVIWRPSTPIVARNSVQVTTRFNESIFVNEVDTGLNAPASAGLPGTTVDLSPSLTFPITIESIGVRGNSTGGNASEGRVTNFIIDGQVLINGVNNSYGANGFHLDFADPDDLGADRSGNGNDFTATGFNTNPVGIFSNDLTTSGGALENPQNSFDGKVEPGNQTWTVADSSNGFFGPTTPIKVNTSLEVYHGGVYLEWQGVKTGYVGAQGWLQVPGTGELSAANPLKIGVDGTASSSATWTGIRVDGRILVDNTGVDFDSMQDSPTQNYATLNPLGFNNGRLNPNITPTNANLGYTMGSNPDIASTFFVPTAGLHYFEFRRGATAETGLRIYAPASDNTGANGTGAQADLLNQGTRYLTQGNHALAPTGQVAKTGSANMQIAINADTQRMYIGDGDGNWWRNNAGTYTVGAFDAAQPTIDYSGLDDDVVNNMQMGFYGSTSGTLNFGQQPFIMAIPAGWDADDNLQTQNLPAATIRNGRDHFQAITGPGTGANGTVVTGQRGGDWSKDVYGSASTTYDPDSTAKLFLGPPDASITHGPWRMFDGDLIDKACKTGTGSAQTWIYWRPEPAITGVTQLTIHTSNAQTVRINGGPPTGQSSSGAASTYPIEIANPPATLTSIAIQGNSISSATVMGITINNEVLIENSILTQAQNTFDNALYWIKDRDNNSTHHQLVDTVRGNTLAMWSDDMGAEQNYAAPAGNSVAWCWNAPDTFTPTQTGGLTNMAGRRNVAAGFSILTWNGTGANATITHGLTDAPEFILFFNQEATNLNRLVYHVGNTSTATATDGAERSLILNTTATGASESSMLNNTAPTNAANGGTISLGSAGGSNGDADMVAYCWHSVPNYSAFGVYRGNNNVDGPFCWCGFRPAAVLLKCTGESSDWIILDSTRDINNPADTRLRPNQAAGENQQENNAIDILSNGFKIRGEQTNVNENNQPFIWAAWAENPFGSSNTSPANAR